MSRHEVLASSLSGRKIAAGTVAAGLLLIGAGSTGQEAGASVSANAQKTCVNNENQHVHTQFNLTSPNPDYCLREAFPMGRTDIFHKGNYGELGLVAIKITFEGKPYACVVPVTGHDNFTTLTPEAFSLNEDCLPDPGNK